MSGETRFIHTEASKALRRKRVTLIAPSGAAMCTACASSPPLKRLAEAAYELDAFKPKLSHAEADRRIATLSAKLKLLDGPPHTL
jgi:hypothetical protein